VFKLANCQISVYDVDTQYRNQTLTNVSQAIPNFGTDTTLFNNWNASKFSKQEDDLTEIAITVYQSCRLPGCTDTLIQLVGKLLNRSPRAIGDHLKNVHGSVLGLQTQRNVPVLDEETISRNLKRIRAAAHTTAMQLCLKYNNTNDARVGNNSHGFGSGTNSEAANQRQAEQRNSAFDMDAVEKSLLVSSGNRIQPRNSKGKRGSMCSSAKLAFISMCELWTMGGIDASLQDDTR